MSDEYAKVSRGKLKLKTDGEISKKKKKRKDKEREREKIANFDSSTVEITQPESSSTERKLTKAEQSFKKMQDKMQKKRIMEKASVTHKQQVERFNEKLDNLTEHFGEFHEINNSINIK